MLWPDQLVTNGGGPLIGIKERQVAWPDAAGAAQLRALLYLPSCPGLSPCMRPGLPFAMLLGSRYVLFLTLATYYMSVS